MASKKNMVRVAALGDMHCGRVPAATLAGLLGQVNDRADVLVLCGDLTDHGTADEARPSRKSSAGPSACRSWPCWATTTTTRARWPRSSASCATRACRCWTATRSRCAASASRGSRGFSGGFGRYTLEPWGEDSVKAFVREAVEETLKLESALARLRTDQRVAVLHYAPIQETVEGEPVEIYAFLGCSRMEEPLHRYSVSVVFHGHAHRGKPEGKLRNDVPVYNVALPLMQRSFPDRPPFRIVELPAAPSSGEPEALTVAGAAH